MRRLTPLLLAAVQALPVVAAPVTAGASRAAVAAPLVAKWQGHSPYAQIWPNYANETEAFSSVAVGDVTGDGQPDIVVGAPDGFLYGFSKAGARFMAHNTGPGVVAASPVLVDITGDGVLDVIAANMNGDVVGVSAVNGQAVRRFTQRACTMWREDIRCAAFSTPAVADIDRDGQLEITVAGSDHFLYVWNLDTSTVPGFPVFLLDSTWSSPAVGDLDKDGWLEIVIGADMDVGGGSGCCPFGGELWAIRHDGSVMWRKDVPGEVIFSAPALTDLDGDGWLDVVFGTGLYFVNIGQPSGPSRLLHARDRFGNPLPGWPVTLGAPSMTSPAIGNLSGDGKPEVVATAEDGRVSVFGSGGQLLWSACNMNSQSACTGVRYPVHSSASIADVDNDGRQDVVSAMEGTLRVFDGGTGAVKYDGLMPWSFPAAGTPTVASVDGQAWIVQATSVDVNRDARLTAGDEQTVWAFSTAKPLGSADWPMFKQNARRTGGTLDASPPTALFDPPPAGTQHNTKLTVGWWGTDQGSGVSRFQVDVRDGSGPWVRWFDGPPRYVVPPQASGSADFFGVRGHTYTFRVRAVDGAGNVGAWTSEASVRIADDATRALPFDAAYAIATTGTLSWLSSPPASGPSWTFSATRGFAVRPGGAGGYVLDLYGGIHAFGGAPVLTASAYWPGWDIARGLALNPDGAGGYVLDGWGGLHEFGNAAPVSAGGYWPGWDIAVGVVLLRTSTASRPAGYVMDGYGGLHAFGSAPPATGGPYWPGWRIARSVVVNPSGPGGWVLDGYGGVHPFSGAPSVDTSVYWSGWDIARSMAFYDSGAGPKGYVLDGWGGVHVVNAAPPVAPSQYTAGRDVSRFMSIG